MVERERGVLKMALALALREKGKMEQGRIFFFVDGVIVLLFLSLLLLF